MGDNACGYGDYYISEYSSLVECRLACDTNDLCKAFSFTSDPPASCGLEYRPMTQMVAGPGSSPYECYAKRN